MFLVDERHHEGVQVSTLGRGVLLPELKLALDTSAPGFTSIVSHGHGDHIPWDATRAHASAETADIMALRSPLIDVEAMPWRESVKLGAATVTLYPAGHILGSAVIHIEASDGSTLLYTGDTKTRTGLSCPPPEFPEAEELVIESTFGLPIFRFPGTTKLQERAVAFARTTLAEGDVPVFLGHALGKAQELLLMLTAGGVPTIAHGAVWNMCEVYKRHGVQFPLTRPYEPGKVEGAALLVPDSFREHPMIAKLDARVAYCSGWARLSKSRVQLDVDFLLPLSDHADYEGLLDIVDRVKPKRVLTNHGYADTFAHLVKKTRGIDASPLVVGHTSDEDAGPGPVELSGADAR